MTNLYEIIEERDRYKIYPSIVIDDIHKFTLFLQTRTEENVDDILLEKLDFILQATDRRIQKLPKDSEFINRALDILRLEPVIRHLKRLSGNEIKNISTAMKFQFLKEYFRAQSFGFKANIEEREEKNRDNIPYFIEDFLEGKKGREEIHKHIQIGIEYMKEPRVKNIYKTLLRELYMGIRCIQSESTDKKAL